MFIYTKVSQIYLTYCKFIKKTQTETELALKVSHVGVSYLVEI